MSKVERHKSSLETAVRERLAEMQPKRNLEWLAGQLEVTVETLRNWFEAPEKVKAFARIALVQVLGIPEEDLFVEIRAAVKTKDE